jgi:hypothetical protein
MTTKKYLETLLEGSGHLNQYPQKTNIKAPDYAGYIKIDGRVWRLSAWIKESKGKKSISLNAKEADFDGNIYNDIEP